MSYTSQFVEDRWLDVFIAYFPTRNVSLTLAAVAPSSSSAMA